MKIRQAIITFAILALTAAVSLAAGTDGDGSVTIGGELKQWHKVTLDLAGPWCSEGGDPSPFLDYRMTVTFTQGASTYTVPGYFAADGNAGESSATEGNTWRAHFAPPTTGTWQYEVDFRAGTDVAVNTGGTEVSPFDGASDSFVVNSSDKSGKDYRAPEKGKLVYTGKSYPEWMGGSGAFIKAACNSPEVFLEYNDFDGTPTTDRDYSEHIADWNTGDPSWQSGEGKGIIGVVNYLSSIGMNSHYFLTMNLHGDGKQAFPFINDNDSSRTTYDVSKLDQWAIVFDHMMAKGVQVQFVTTERENQNFFEYLDGGTFADSRKLYYRELVARFGYLNAITWNIGEENAWQKDTTYGKANTTAQRLAFADYLMGLLPYDDNIAIHNGPSNTDDLFIDLVGESSYRGISYQGNYQDESHGHDRIVYWRNQAESSGYPWIVSYDEPYTSGEYPTLDIWRQDSLWASLTGGAAGVGHYIGSGGDLWVQNYRDYSSYYEILVYAKDFFSENIDDMFSMGPDDSLVTSGWCLANPGTTYVVYLKNGGTTDLDLSGVSGAFNVRWFDPRNGGALQAGSVTTVNGGGTVSLGTAPSSTTSDWVILVNTSENSNGAFLESNGVVVFDVEALEPVSPWVEESSVSDYLGDGYFRGTADYFNSPGNGTVSYPVYISSAGRYQLQWRSRITFGTSSTDYNDSFARLTDADGNPVTPVSNDNVADDSWYKVYMNTVGSWDWQTSNHDNTPRSLSWNLAADTLYYVEISVRSKHHAVDRIVLWDHNQHSFASTFTGAGDNISALDALSLSERAGEVLIRQPIQIPATIQAEDFMDAYDITSGNSGGSEYTSAINEDVDIQATSDPAGGTANVGYTDPGEWLEYSIDAGESGGTYDIILRLAANAPNKTVQILLDGNYAGSLTAPSGGWQAFEDRTLYGVTISGGVHTLRVVMTTGDVNFNYLAIGPEGGGEPHQIVDFTPFESGQSARASDVDTDSGDTWNFSDTTPLVSSAGGTNDVIHGGLTTSWAAGQDYNPGLLYLGWNGGGFQMRVNPTDKTLCSAQGIYVWNKADFLIGSSETVSLVAGNSMSFDTSWIVANSREVRFVVNQAGNYYVSAYSVTSGGSGSLADVSTTQWAPLNTLDYTYGSFEPLTLNDIQAVGLYYDLEIANDQLVFRLTDFQVQATVGHASYAYEAWSAQWVDDIGASTNDYDGDGVANLAEYALGGNPTNATNRGEPFEIIREGGNMHYVYPQRSDNNALVYQVLTCTNLMTGGWTNTGYATGTNVTGGAFNFVTNDIGVVEFNAFIKLNIQE